MEALHETKTYDAISHAGLRKLDDGAKRHRRTAFRQRNWTEFNNYTADRHTTDAASDWGCQPTDRRHTSNPDARFNEYTPDYVKHARE